MREQEWLADRFGVHRQHLRAVAYRMLGSLSEADDAVQESWLRRNGCTNVQTGLIQGAIHYVVEDQPDVVTKLIEKYASATR